MDIHSKQKIIEYVQTHLDSISFKPLGPDEKEATDEEKIRVLTDVLECDPGLFLSNWGRFLSQSALQHFRSIKDNYEVNQILSQLLQEDQSCYSLSGKQTSLTIVIRNRRYEYLKRKLRDSNYFSDDAMQKRDPMLFEQLVGQYMTSAERSTPFAANVSLVDRVLKDIDLRYAHESVEEQKQIEEEQFEEEEEESDEDEPDHENSTENDSVEEDTAQLREDGRAELIRILEERFLAGKDTDFDYSLVDYNEEFDDLEQLEQDAHDHYFEKDDDDEEEEEGEGEEDVDLSKQSVYTGELDY